MEVGRECTAIGVDNMSAVGLKYLPMCECERGCQDNDVTNNHILQEQWMQLLEHI